MGHALTLAGISAHLMDTRQLVAGRWPKLRKLVLGDVAVDWRTAVTDPSAKRPFVAFLEAHGALQSLSMSRHNIHHTCLSSLSRDALPLLQEFTGTLEQFQMLRNTHPSLKSVTFNDPMLTRELTPLAIAVVLQHLKNLTHLRVSFVLPCMTAEVSSVHSSLHALSWSISS